MTLAWNQGALLQDNGTTRFRVWAPKADQVSVEIYAPGPKRTVALVPQPRGYHEATVNDAGEGTRYKYLLNNESAWPDPASRLQPDGVHEASAVTSREFPWSDAGWAGPRLKDYAIYELHVGTFTDEGTFDSMIEKLPYLKSLGITALELMPVSQFPGGRNWGYDGTYPYAAQSTYGGPYGLKRLVDAAHKHGLAVVLDVVYNHLGPEGNYSSLFGPYFTDMYKTPWGMSLNFDGDWSDEVRRFFIGSALYWIEDCHIDALRLDAVHAIIDPSARPFLQDLAEEVHLLADRLGRRIYLIAENDRNDPSFVMPPELGGLGLDSQWSDDFHHALHTVLTGESQGYYEDFGSVSQLAKAMQEGFVYGGEYSPHRHRRHGASSRHLRGYHFVICSQNHDQVGNRMMGDRLTASLSDAQLRLAAAACLLAPNIPLLWMGEEYGEKRPFQYFVSHGDEGLVEAVRQGRREEFAAFHALGEAPDPQSEDTYANSRLDWSAHQKPGHANLLEWYRELLRIRREWSVLCELEKVATTASAHDSHRTLVLTRSSRLGDAMEEPVVAAFNFSDQARTVSFGTLPGAWVVELTSADEKWGGAGEGVQAGTQLDASCNLDLEVPPQTVLVLRRQKSLGRKV